MAIIVQKFGGTSVGSAQAIRETKQLIAKYKTEWGSVAVIASAMGSKPVKVTDFIQNSTHKIYEFLKENSNVRIAFHNTTAII